MPVTVRVGVAEQVGVGPVHRGEVLRGEHLRGRSAAHEAPVEADHPVGVARHHRQVVADQQEAEAGVALDLGQEVAELLFPGDVDAGDRLVEQQDVGRVPQREGEQHPLELPAREPAQGALEEVGDAGPLEALPGDLPGAAGGAEEDGAPLGGEREEVEHRDRHVRVQGKPLRHVPDAGSALAVLRRAAETDFSRVRHLAQDREEQGGLSRAVGADQGGDLPAPDVGVDPRKDLHPSLPDGQVADLERVEMFAHGHRADSASLSVERFRRIASS